MRGQLGKDYNQMDLVKAEFMNNEIGDVCTGAIQQGLAAVDELPFGNRTATPLEFFEAFESVQAEKTF